MFYYTKLHTLQYIYLIDAMTIGKAMCENMSSVNYLSICLLYFFCTSDHALLLVKLINTVMKKKINQIFAIHIFY